MSPDTPPAASSTPSTPSPPAAPTAPKAKPAAPKAKPASATAPAASPKPAAPPKKEAPAKPAAAATPAKAATKGEGAARPKRKESTEPAGPAPKVVDASGLVLGRAASLIAKRLLSGEHIVVVNVEKAVVVGSPADLLERYRLAVARGSIRKGPHFPRRPDRIFRRTVRGMLPFDHSRGREAWRRVRTYVGVPEEFRTQPKETLESAKARPALRPPLTLGEISRRVGGVGPW